MVAKKRGKRSSGGKHFEFFEISDSDVSPDNSDNECDEPQKKILKTDSNLVQYVISNLENEAKNVKSTDVVEIIDDSIEETSNNVDESNVSVLVVGENSLIEVASCHNSSEQDCLQKNEILDDSVLIIDDICSIKEGDCISSNQNKEEIDSTSLDLKLDEPIPVNKEEQEVITETDAPEPTIQLIFNTTSVSDLYKLKFLNFINSSTDLCVCNEDGLSITLKKELRKKPEKWITLDETGVNDTIVHNSTDTRKKPEEWITLDETGVNDAIIVHSSQSQPIQVDELVLPSEQIPSKKKKRKKNKKEKSLDKDLFVLDTNPSQNVDNTTKYASKFQIDINKNKDEKEVKVSLQVCFNCDQAHALKDCPFPRNQAKINMKRQQFKIKKEKQSSRYHLEEDQKYAYLSPGKISTQLREALGLKENELPPYVYHMRQLGYPPGWLEEAKVVYSNLALIDAEGNHVTAKNAKKKLGLDPHRIVEYPGFNVPMGKNCKDEYKLYRVPPYSKNHNKNAMIEYFENQYSKQQDDFKTIDMDLDVSNETNSVVKRIEKYSDKKSVPSPSLVDLETQKLSLLAALDDNSNSNSKPEDSETLTSETVDKEPIPPGVELTELDDSTSEYLTEASSQLSSSEIIKETNENSFEDSQEASSSKTAYESIISSNYGTPILKSNSPYIHLPNPDNFMKDVSPVINFENLPNSTGKYEKMVGLLHKVRNTMKKFQNCDS